MVIVQELATASTPHMHCISHRMKTVVANIISESQLCFTQVTPRLELSSAVIPCMLFVTLWT